MYRKLARQFPLRPIKKDEEHGRALNIISELMAGDVDRDAGDYLDTLILLVNKYEDQNYTPESTHLTPQQTLRAIMRANRMTQAEVG